MLEWLVDCKAGRSKAVFRWLFCSKSLLVAGIRSLEFVRHQDLIDNGVCRRGGHKKKVNIAIKNIFAVSNNIFLNSRSLF